MAGHWSNSGKKVKSEFDGDHLVLVVPYNHFQSPNHIATHLILLTQP
jgi:hypothetical protein